MLKYVCTISIDRRVTNYRSQEAPLLHSPRAIAFHNADTVALAYPPPDYDVFTLKTLAATEVVTPPPKNAAAASTSMAGMGAFTGLTGYMTLGLGAKPKSDVVAIGGDEILIVKDSKSLILASGFDVDQRRRGCLDWGGRQIVKNRYCRLASSTRGHRYFKLRSQK